MYSLSNLPWIKINDFLVDVGNVREPKEFCVQVLKKIYQLIPYDQARIYFINDTGKIYDEVLFGVDPMWSEAYIEYFSKVENGRYAIPARRHAISTGMENGCYSMPRIEGGVYDWAKYEGDEFITSYIKPQRIRYSAGFGIHSADNFTKSVYMLDRISRSGYTREEIDLMSIIQPHLDNLHKNLFVLPSLNSCFNKNQDVQNHLTKRESEIAELLCRSLTPTKISQKLYISQPTTYKHIANMHAKLDVSNRQELILKLMKHRSMGE